MPDIGLKIHTETCHSQISRPTRIYLLIMESTITFKEYLSEKKIDSDKFYAAERDLFDSLEHIFMQMHPESFTAQKLFLINPLRRKYLLSQEPETDATQPKTSAKPKIPRR